MRSFHTRLALLLLRCPSYGRRYSCRGRAMLFGAVAAVPHYNVFSRIVAELFTKIFGIPIISFFDDFDSLAPGPLARRALDSPNAFCEILGIRPRPGKSDVGPRVNFLGIRGSSPCAANGVKLQIPPQWRNPPIGRSGFNPFGDEGRSMLWSRRDLLGT